jgi:hypothetical protein
VLQEVLAVASTVLLSLGGAGAIILGLSSWLGRVWAEKILQNARYEHELRVAQENRNDGPHSPEQWLKMLGVILYDPMSHRRIAMSTYASRMRSFILASSIVPLNITPRRLLR